jgi:hypothetical protein
MKRFNPLWQPLLRLVRPRPLRSVRSIRGFPFRRVHLERLENRTLLAGQVAPLSFTAFQTAHHAGHLATANDFDLYTLSLQAGDRITATVSAQSAGSGLQSVLRIFDSTGNPVALDDQEGSDPQLTFQASHANAGIFQIGVSSAGNDDYNPDDPASGKNGSTTGVYSLDVRLTSAAPSADVVGASFRLTSPGALSWGDTIKGQFTIENRGGADSTGYRVQLILSSGTRFDGFDPSQSLDAVFASGPPATPGAGSAYTDSFSALLPQTAPASFPLSGPVYVGLLITPNDPALDPGTSDKSGVHRGEDWESLTIVTQVPAGMTDLSAVDSGLNTQAGGTILSPTQADSYRFTFGVSGSAATITNNDDRGFAGLDFNQGGSTPPDTCGAAGPSGYVEVVNQSIALYSLQSTGTPADSASLSSFFYTVGGLTPTDANSFLTDPSVVFDERIGRFIVGNADVDTSAHVSSFDLAVSRTSAPATLSAADWTFYKISTTENVSTGAAADFNADYPGNVGYNADAFVFTLNMIDSNGRIDHVQVTSISAGDLASGVSQANLHVYQNDSSGSTLRPATMHDALPGDPLWLVEEGGNDQSINVVKMTNVLASPATFTTTNLAVNAYNPAVFPLNPDGSVVTNVIDSGILKAAEAGNTLVATQTVSVAPNQDDARWYSVDVSSGTPVLKDQGDVSAGKNTYLYFPSIDINAAGDIGMTYMQSGTDSARDFVSMYVTGRLPGDPTGTMAVPVAVPAGTGVKTYSAHGRAGDLSGISVDPANGTFWVANEFANTDKPDNWGTAIANFSVGPASAASHAGFPPASGWLRVTVMPTGGSLVPRLVLEGPNGRMLVQSDDGVIDQHLLAGSYTLIVSSCSGTGSYQLVSQFVQANPPLDAASVGFTPSALAVADVNGDGIPDLVVANTSNNTVSVLLGNGDGTFQDSPSYLAQHTYAVGQLGDNASMLTVADLTGNGRLDIIVTNYYDDTVSVLLGNGDGSFQDSPDYLNQHTFKVGHDPQAVAVADVNGDGIPDLVVANFNRYSDSSGNSYPIPGTVSVLTGNGDGTFQTQQTFPVGYGPRSVAVADLNGDGEPDIVTTNYSENTVSVLLNTTASGSATLTFDTSGKPIPVGQSPGAVAVADVNGDGIPDLLVANFQGNNGQSQGLSVLLGKGDGSFQPQKQFSTGFVPFSMAVGDVNGDGTPDVVVGNFGAHTVSVLQGTGDGSFDPPQNFATGFYPGALVVADVTGDGKPDIVVTNSGSSFNPGSAVSVLPGNGDGSFQAPPAIATGATPVATVVADLNGDGKRDIVTANQNDGSISVLLGNGDGSFQPRQTISLHFPPNALAVADVNGDGKPDLVVAYLNGTLSVLLGNGDGTFQNSPAYLKQHTYKVGKDPDSVAVADVNGDGKPDIVVTNRVSNTVTVLLGNGDGSFQDSPSYLAQHTFAVGLDPESVAVTDLNGDGKPDIVVGYLYGVSVLPGNGDGTFQPRQGIFAGYYVTSVAVADLNGDGRPDLVVGHYIPPQPQPNTLGSFLQNSGYPNNAVSVLLNTTPAGAATVSFEQPQTLDAGPYPSSVTVADLTGDGKPDIIAANFRGNSVSVLLNTTTKGAAHAAFQSQQTFDAGFTPTSVNVADMNGDGIPDIIVSNDFGGSVTVLLGDGQSGFTPATAERQAGTTNTPLVGDLDGDGILDRVILDSSGNILFRKGRSDGSFDSPIILNPGHPARDLALVHTPLGLALAAADLNPTVTRGAPPVYSVSLYTVAADGTVNRGTLFTTRRLPTRIVAGDLTGNGLDDIVVADSLDNSIQVLFQQLPDASLSPAPLSVFTSVPITLPTAEAPSDVALVSVGDPAGLPDILVSNQASGDVTVFYNDPNHTFSASSTFRAGIGLYGLDAAGATVSSRQQTISLASGNLTGTGRNDLVVVNRGSHSFTVLANDGTGGFANPQTARTTATSFGLDVPYQPGPVVVGDFDHDGRPDVAILMEDTKEIWVYLNKGDGTFASPIVSPAGTFGAPTGFTFVPGDNGQRDRFLVGNAFGDILTLVGDGTGRFQVDRGNPNGVPLAVGQTRDNTPYAIVADQNQDKLLLYLLNPATNQFDSAPTPISAQSVGLLVPGAVQLADLSNGKAPPYLIVADQLGNDVLVYPALPDGTFGRPTSYPVGDNPVSITVADINGDGVKDLLVANQGSNDVSILFGRVDRKTGAWSATSGPRLHSGGIGPLAVAVQNTGGPNGPNLLVSNHNGKVALMQGIGSAGLGSGFFRDAHPPIFNLDRTIVGSIASPGGGFFVVGGDGSISALSGGHFTTIVGQGVATLDTSESPQGPLLVAGLDDGSIEVLSIAGTVLAHAATDATAELSALQAMPKGAGLDVFVTQTGSDVPLVVSFAFIPIVTELPPSTSGAQGTNTPGSELILVATLLAGGLFEGAPASATETLPGDEVFALFLPTAPVLAANHDNRIANDFDDRQPIAALAPPERPDAPSWETFPLGVNEALQKHRMSRPPVEDAEQLQDSLGDDVDPLEGIFTSPTVPPDRPEAPTPPEASSEVSARVENVRPGPEADRLAEQPTHAAPPTAEANRFRSIKGLWGSLRQESAHQDDRREANGFGWMEILPATAALVYLVNDDGEQAEDT